MSSPSRFLARTEVAKGSAAVVLSDALTLESRLDPAAVGAALTERVRFADPIVGGIPVHYAGQMAPMPALATLLRDAGLGERTVSRRAISRRGFTR